MPCCARNIAVDSPTSPPPASRTGTSISSEDFMARLSPGARRQRSASLYHCPPFLTASARASSTVEPPATGADTQSIDMNRKRPMFGFLSMLILASLADHVSVAAQEPAPPPQTFHTAARFSVDSDVLRLRTAVALAEPHARVNSFSWVRVYFYAFDLSAADLAGLSHGSTDGLERRRLHPSAGDPDVNHSRAALHFLLDKDSRLSNASLEVPGLTCTI